MAMPREGVPTEQDLVGMTGAWPRKHAPTSVPPEMLMIGHRPRPTTSANQRYGSGFHGSPVEPRIRSFERSRDRTGSVPAGINARTRVGEIPSTETPCRSHISHTRPGPGWLGAPSYMNAHAPF